MWGDWLFERVDRSPERKECSNQIIKGSRTHSVRLYGEQWNIAGRHVAFSPWSNVLPRYLYFALQNTMPEFLAKYKSGINLKYEAVKFLKINVPTMEQQKQIIEVLMTIEKAERAEQKEIETLKGFKEGMLEKMFISEERKG